MATKVESYLASDGSYFPDEISAVRHEVLADLLARCPELKDRWTIIQSNVDAISRALQRLAVLLPENHPEVPEKTTLRPSDKPRWNTCAGSGARPACDMCPQSFGPDAVVPDCFVSPVAVDHGELAGTCDCSAGMNGADDHAITCPSHRENVRAREIMGG